MKYKTILDLMENFFSRLSYVFRHKFPWRYFIKIKSLIFSVMNFKPLPQHLLHINSLTYHFQKVNPVSKHLRKVRLLPTLIDKSRSGSFKQWKFKIDDIRGRHVVIGGLLVYLLCFLIGLGSAGISLEDVDPNPKAFTTPESINGLSANSSIKVSAFPEEYPYNSISKELRVPATYLKKIFLNNLGLNIVIIAGAFSLLAFSMIVLVFNALHIGMLVKGIYNSYGLKLAASLVLPHLVLEVASHILSLYLAYLILRQLIVPVVVKGEGIEFNSFINRKVLGVFSLVIILTLIGALVEIFVTPKLI